MSGAGLLHEFSNNAMTLTADDLPSVANAPASPGKFTDIPGNTVASVELTAGDLVPGVKYKLTLIPYNLGTNPAVPTDLVRGIYKCAAAAGGVASMNDGEPLVTYAPEIICLPAGSTKVRVYFLLDTATNLDCKAYLSVKDS